MQEIQFGGEDIWTKDPSVEQLLKAAQNPKNKEVRLIPDIEKPKEYYTIRKGGRWVTKKY